MSLSINSVNGNVQNQNRPDPAQMKAKIDGMLTSAGATAEQLATAQAAGPSGIQALAAELGVTLPQPPQRQQGSIFEGQNQNNEEGTNPIKAQLDASLTAAGATADELATAQAQGFEGIQALAEKYGVELPQPPQNPEGAQNQGSKPSGPPPEIVSALQTAGATDDEIAAIDGPEAAQELADKYGVTLPEPPQKSNSSSATSSSTNTSSVMQQIISLFQSLGLNIG